ncbi:hypothetical protein AHAS_Ahas19G0207100 [Arachis hypogaea]
MGVPLWAWHAKLVKPTLINGRALGALGMACQACEVKISKRARHLVFWQETSSLDYAFNKFMQDCSPEQQNDPYCDEVDDYSSCGWEDQNQRAFDSSYSTYQEASSLERTFNSFMQNYPTSPLSFSLENPSSLDFASAQNSLQDPYNSFHQPQHSLHYTEDSSQHSQNSFHNSQDSFHTPQNNFTTTHPYPQNFSQPSSFELVSEDLLQKSRELLERQEQSWREQEILFQKMDGHLDKIRKHSGLASIEDENQSVSEEVEEEAPCIK